MQHVAGRGSGGATTRTKMCDCPFSRELLMISQSHGLFFLKKYNVDSDIRGQKEYQQFMFLK